MPYKPRLLVDFDGVIHQYSRGWADGTAYDPPKRGAQVALEHLTELGYEVILFSTRPAAQIVEWLSKWGFKHYVVTDQKMPAVAIIDDRAIRFTTWHQALSDVTELYPVAPHKRPLLVEVEKEEIKPELWSRGKCKHCKGDILYVNYALRPEWMHFDTRASFPTVSKGSMWKGCRIGPVAEPEVV